MNVPDIIIAVDGYSSTGKSTFAKLIASTFSFLYLDSGAMYRAVTLFALENGYILANGTVDTEHLIPAIQGLDIHFEHSNGSNLTFIGTRSVEKEIRTLQVSNFVSPIAVIPQVRSFVDGKLHEFGEKGRIVMDGRDIGTTVYPNAQVKIFMVADDSVRAQRRFAEMVERGENTTYEEVLNNLKQRDYIDSHREASPLSKAPDAFVLDNTDMTLHEEIVWLQGLLQGLFNIKA